MDQSHLCCRLHHLREHIHQLGWQGRTRTSIPLSNSQAPCPLGDLPVNFGGRGWSRTSTSFGLQPNALPIGATRPNSGRGGGSQTLDLPGRSQPFFSLNYAPKKPDIPQLARALLSPWTTVRGLRPSACSKKIGTGDRICTRITGFEAQGPLC